VPEARTGGFVQAAASAGVALTTIGRVIAGTAAPRFLDADGVEIALPRLSYSHF
jgi:thiamine-monophosphate kinase